MTKRKKPEKFGWAMTESEEIKYRLNYLEGLLDELEKKIDLILDKEKKKK